jgi:hypothetical protein
MFLASYGKATIETDSYTIYVIVSIIICVGVFAYNTYKNFDVTAEGSLGTRITRALKAGVLASSSVMALLEESEDVDNATRTETADTY